MMTYHTWAVTKHHHGSFRFHDNILLIFFIISLTMLSNYLVNLLVPLEKTKGKAFTNLGQKLPIYIFTDFLVFCITVVFEFLLKNINPENINLENVNRRCSLQTPIDEYEHFCLTDKFAELLHMLFCSLGMHQCDDRNEVSINSELNIDDVHKEGIKGFVRKEDMTESLASNWLPDCEQYNGCYLCKFKEHFCKTEKHNRLVFKSEISPIINLNEYAFSIFSLGCYCFNGLNNDYSVFPNISTDTCKEKMTKKFISTLFLLLDLCREFYLNYSKKMDVSSVYHSYKALTYEVLHHYIHSILQPNSSTSGKNIDEIENNSQDYSNSTQTDTTPAKHKWFNVVNKVVYRRRFQWLTQYRNDSNEVLEMNKILKQRIQWFNQLDKAIDIIIDAIVDVVYQQKYDTENVNLNANMLQEIFSYASEFLDTCMYLESSDQELINKVGTNISKHKFLYICTIVKDDDNSQNPNFHELQLYFQRIVRDREALIKDALDILENNIIDSFFSEVWLIYLRKKFPAQNVESPEERDIKMLCQKVIEESQEEINNEIMIPIFIFARLALFWGVAVYMRGNEHFLDSKSAGQKLLKNIFSLAENKIHLFYQLKICLIEAGICDYCSGKSELNYQWYPFYIKLFSRPLLKRVIILKLLLKLECNLKTVIRDCIKNIMNHTFEMQTVLVSMYYVSVVLDQQSCVVVNYVKSIVSDRLCYLNRNPFPTTFEENPYEGKVDQPNSTEAADDKENTSETEEKESLPSFMDVMEKKMGLQSGELSMYYQSTYHFDEIRIGLVDFQFNYEAVFFQDDNNIFPYRTKRYIQIAMVAIILIGFLVLSIENSELQGPTVKEWSFLSSIGIVLNILFFEPIKVFMIIIFQIY